MKKVLIRGLVLALILVVSLSLFGCVNPAPEGTVTVSAKAVKDGFDVTFIDSDGNKTTVSTTGEFLADALKVAKDEAKFTVDGSDGDYGYFVSEIGKLKPDSTKNEYISFYSTIDDDKLSFKPTMEKVDDVEYYMANVGVSQMPLQDGVSYLFKILTF